MPNTILETLDKLDTIRHDWLFNLYAIEMAKNHDEIFSTLRRALADIEEMKKVEAFAKEVLSLDKTSWTTYVGVDPDKQWNDCNAEWRGDIKRLAKIHGITL